MSEEFTAHVEGLDELERMLEELTPKAAKAAVRRAALKAGEIWQEAIEERAPRRTGFLSEHITIKTKTTGGDDDSTGGITVLVGPEKSAFYAMFQEFGTKHQPAKPFIGPAYEEKKDEVLETFEKELQATLERLHKT